MRITVEDKDTKQVFDMYSEESVEVLSHLWSKLCLHNKYTHNITWLGVPIIQFSNDIIMMQELIWKMRPDVIIECGLAHGGSALFYASLLEIIGKGYVIGIDIDIRPYNKIVIQNHPLSHRVKMIEGSSISESVVNKLKKKILGSTKIMVVLDSNHSTEHVLNELNIYKNIVTTGCYIVVMDGIQKYVWDIPNGKKEWKEDNPLDAIEIFLEKNPHFEVDSHYERLKVTTNPKGFLKKVLNNNNLI